MPNIIHVSGTPQERGKQLGELWRDDMSVAFLKWTEHFEALGHDADAIAQRLAESIAWDLAEKHTPEIVDELKATAVASGLEWKVISALSLLDESWAATGGAACTAIAVTRPNMRSVGQNMDLPAWTHGLARVAVHEESSGIKVGCVTYPGMPATCGANSAGLGVAVNALEHLPVQEAGVPVAFITRTILSMSDALEAADFLTSIPHGVGQSYTVLDPQHLVRIEAAADQVVDLPTEGLVFGHSNHALGRADVMSESSRLRLDAVDSASDSILDHNDVMTVLLNRETGVCMTPGRWDNNLYSFASFVSNVNESALWVNLDPAGSGKFEQILH